jgi:hypothetical protein
MSVREQQPQREFGHADRLYAAGIGVGDIGMDVRAGEDLLGAGGAELNPAQARAERRHVGHLALVRQPNVGAGDVLQARFLRFGDVEHLGSGRGGADDVQLGLGETDAADDAQGLSRR